MQVNASTMLVSDFTDAERADIVKLCEDIIMRGKIDWENPIVKQWMDVCAPDDRHKLLLFSTVMPQRLLLSLHK